MSHPLHGSAERLRGSAPCQLCGGGSASTMAWSVHYACPECTGVHWLCPHCVAGWDLGEPKYLPTGPGAECDGMPLERCPFADETRVAMELLGGRPDVQPFRRRGKLMGMARDFETGTEAPAAMDVPALEEGDLFA